MNKENMPEIKIGVVAVSRDCFPESLSVEKGVNGRLHEKVRKGSHL